MDVDSIFVSLPTRVKWLMNLRHYVVIVTVKAVSSVALTVCLVSVYFSTVAILKQLLHTNAGSARYCRAHFTRKCSITRTCCSAVQTSPITLLALKDW